MATRIKQVEITAGDYKRVHWFPVRNYHRGRRTKQFRPSSAAQAVPMTNAERAELLREMIENGFIDADESGT